MGGGHKIGEVPDIRNAYTTSRARCSYVLRYCFYQTHTIYGSPCRNCRQICRPSGDKGQIARSRRAKKTVKYQTPGTHTRLLVFAAPTARAIVFITYRPLMDRTAEMVKKYEKKRSRVGVKKIGRQEPVTRNAYSTSCARCFHGLRY